MLEIKSFFKNLKEQIYILRRRFVLLYYFLVFLILAMAFLVTAVNPLISHRDLFIDILALVELPFYTGSMSQLGILIWSASATSCLLAFYLLKKFNKGSLNARRFLLYSGLISLFLMFDDMFLLHEEVAEQYFDIGQKKVYLIYFLIIVLFLYFNRSEILSSDYLLLVIAFGLFGGSIFLDVLADTFSDILEASNSFFAKHEVFLEDGIKFTGIASWLLYYLNYINKLFDNTFGAVLSSANNDEPK